MDDRELVLAAAEGDKQAFAALYDRYAQRIHDYCCSVLRDPHEGADIAQDVFITAASRLHQLRDPDKVRPWLYAIARHACLRRAKKRSRTVLAGDAFDDGSLAVAEAPVDERLPADEMQRLVWDAADGLSERDRAILDLNLRQGLDGQDLADALGVTLNNAYVMLSRLRDQVERSLGALLVARTARGSCDDLEAVLVGWDGAYTPLMRKRIARHVDDCEACTEARERQTRPLAALAAVPLVGLPGHLRESVLDKIQLCSATGRGDDDDTGLGGGGGKWLDDGFPPPLEQSGRRRRIGALVPLAAAGLLLAGLVPGSPGATLLETGAKSTSTTSRRSTTTRDRSDTPRRTTSTSDGTAGAETGDDDTTSSTTRRSTTTTTRRGSSTTSTTARPTTTTTARPAVGRLVVSPGALRMGSSRSGTVRITNDGGGPLTWSASVTSGPFSVGPGGGTLAAGQATTVTVSFAGGNGEGSYTGNLRVTAGAAGSANVALSATTNAAPSVDSLNASPYCGPRGDARVTISGSASDKGGIASIRVSWSGPGSSSGTTTSSAQFSVEAGPFTGPGRVSFSVTATDTDGQSTTRSGSTTAPDCSGQIG